MAGCGLPQAAKDLKDLAAQAEEQLGALQEDALGGLADALNGASEGILGKLEEVAALPEPPQLELQAEMSALVASAGDPGKMLEKFKGIQDGFPGIDTNKILSDIGIDAAAIEKASAGVLDKINSVAGGLPTTDDIKNLVGGFEPPFTLDVGAIQDKICAEAPNLKLDAAGDVIKEGLESLQPTKVAEKLQAAADKVEAPAVAKVVETNVALKEHESIIVRETDEEIAAIMKVRTDRMAAEAKPLQIDVRAMEMVVRLSGSAVAAERARALRHHISFLKKDILYEYFFAMHTAGANPTPPDEPFLSADDFKEKYKNNADYGNLTKSLKFVVVGG
tara:strand:+ start:4098 stop:5099 length:1002 start_codon:yes stop_codon:yes gene_type:complete